MGVATTARARFLQSPESSEVAINATLRTRWGDAAGDTAQSSVLVNQADATAEAARQLALMAPAFALDSVRLEGVFFDLEGETVRIDYRTAGVIAFAGAATVDLLVTKSTVDLRAGVTTIEGLVAL
jgi:hypothetical protein